MLKDELVQVLDAYDGVFYLPDEEENKSIESSAKCIVAKGCKDIVIFIIFGNSMSVGYLYKTYGWTYHTKLARAEIDRINHIIFHYEEQCAGNGLYIVKVPENLK